MGDEAEQLEPVRRFKFKTFATIFGGAAVAVFFQMGLPAFFDKGHVIEDLLHGGIIFFGPSARSL